MMKSGAADRAAGTRRRLRFRAERRRRMPLRRGDQAGQMSRSLGK
jgi:hypothetical protein